MTGTTATTAAAIIRRQIHTGEAATTAIVAATETAPAPVPT